MQKGNEKLQQDVMDLINTLEEQIIRMKEFKRKDLETKHDKEYINDKDPGNFSFTKLADNFLLDLTQAQIKVVQMKKEIKKMNKDLEKAFDINKITTLGRLVFPM